MSNIKLSIIIPTYNGGDCINDSIESVLNQISKHQSETEFIIRDNCSTDNTHQLVQHKVEKYPNLIRYIKGSSFVEMTQNFIEAIKVAKGEYILLLGDDDLLFPNFIEQTLYFLHKYPNVGLLYYNRITTSRDYSMEGKLKHKIISFPFYKVYNEAKDFINSHISGPDFMSVNVFRKDNFLQHLNFNKETYPGYNFYAIMLRSIEGYKCISIEVPMILQRVPYNREWSDRAALYVIGGLNQIFNDLDNVYPGVYNGWRKHVKKNLDIFNELGCIPLNRDLYKKNFWIMDPYLNTLQKIYAKVLIKCPQYISYPLIISYKIFRKIIHILK